MSLTDHFLTTLFSSKPLTDNILIWSTPNKASNWFTDPAMAASFAQELTRENVYFGCAATPDPNELLAKYQHQARQKKNRIPINTSQIRCAATDTTGIGGVWADIDIVSPNHKKTNLPENMDQVFEILDRIELKPTFVFNTGGGVQAWWLFDDFMDFSTLVDGRNQASILLQAWQGWCKKVISDYGQEMTGQPFDMDSTHDLARVFRLPGTFNQKSQPPKPVTVVAENIKNRYSPQAMQTWLTGQKGISIPTAPAPASSSPLVKFNDLPGFVLDLAASPDLDKFMDLFESDRKFRQSWQHKRPDLPDKSDSSYDMSLASIAFASGWADQEIIDLLVYHRRNRGADMKHPKYYELTLAKSKEIKGKLETAQAAYSQAVKELEEAPSDDPKKDVLTWVSEQFGVPVTRWVKYLTDPPSYVIEIAGNQVAVGNALAVQNQNAVRSAVYSACDIAIPKFKAARWADIITRLGTVKEEIEPDPTETMQGLVHYYLIRYFNEKSTAESFEEALEKDQPFKGEKGFFFTLAKLKEFMSDHRVNPGTGFSKSLRDLGCEIVIKGVKTPTGGWSTKSVWQVPGYLMREITSQQD